MRVLMLSQYFYPEVGATQNRVYEFAKHLAAAGHQVTVIAEFPNHPTGIIPDSYRGKLFERDRMDGFDIVRVWVAASPQKTSARRMAFYLTYMLMAVLGGIFHTEGCDVVFASSPPLFVGVSGYLLSRWKRAAFVFDVRDLWPLVAVALGELSGRRSIRIAERLEHFLYHSADAIVAVTRGFMRHIEGCGVAAENLHHIPNGTIPETFLAPCDREALRSDLGVADRFVVTFAGNHGIAQGLEAVVETARLLADRGDIVFLFIGDGPVKADLVALSEHHGLRNILFHDRVALDAIVPYLQASDALLVPLKKHDVFSTFIPSKLFDFMCCAKPILLSVDGEAREILEYQAEAGLYVPPEDSAALAQAILRLHDEPCRSEQMGIRGREFVLRHYVRRHQAEKLEQLMAALLPNGAAEIPHSLTSAVDGGS